MIQIYQSQCSISQTGVSTLLCSTHCRGRITAALQSAGAAFLLWFFQSSMKKVANGQIANRQKRHKTTNEWHVNAWLRCVAAARGQLARNLHYQAECCLGNIPMQWSLKVWSFHYLPTTAASVFFLTLGRDNSWTHWEPNNWTLVVGVPVSFSNRREGQGHTISSDTFCQTEFKPINLN